LRLNLILLLEACLHGLKSGRLGLHERWGLLGLLLLLACELWVLREPLWVLPVITLHDERGGARVRRVMRNEDVIAMR